MRSNQSEKIRQLNEIFEKTRESMYKIAYHFFQDQDISDDIVQEVYIRIYDKLPLEFDHEAKLLKWCSVICRNLCIDYYRQKIRSRKLLDKIVKDFAKIDTEHPSAEDYMENLMLQEVVEKVLNQTNSTDRMIYTMYAYSTFSIREIAEISKRSINSVRSLIRNINNKIRNLVIKAGLPELP